MVQGVGQPLARSTAMMTRHISQGSAIVRMPAGKKRAFLNCCLRSLSVRFTLAAQSVVFA